MKRCWIGFILLLVLLAGCLAVTFAMTRLHEEMETDLKQAAHYSLSGNWENAELFTNKARKSWEKWAHFRACFADHTPTEEIDGDFEALVIYLQAREAVSFPAACLSLSRQIAAVGEAHALVWWNFF